METGRRWTAATLRKTAAQAIAATAGQARADGPGGGVRRRKRLRRRRRPATIARRGGRAEARVAAATARRRFAMTAPAPAAMTDPAATLFLPDETATEALARRLAPHLAPGDRIALSGPLGAGKSAFARALIRALLDDPEAEVPSPTFTLVQDYDAAARGGRPTPVHHFDLYRLSDPSEVEELGWDDALADGICLIEWPDRADARLPAERLDLALAPRSDGPAGRIARLVGRGPRGAALLSGAVEDATAGGAEGSPR